MFRPSLYTNRRAASRRYLIDTPALVFWVWHAPFASRPIRRADARNDFVADYRLALEHPFPAALGDAKLAYDGLVIDGLSDGASEIVSTPGTSVVGFGLDRRRASEEERFSGSHFGVKRRVTLVKRKHEALKSAKLPTDKKRVVGAEKIGRAPTTALGRLPMSSKKHGASTLFPISFALFELARTHRAYAAELLRELDLFPTQEIFIMTLAEHRTQTQRQLVQTLRLDHSTVAKSLRRLESAGLVERNSSAEDGRVSVVSLTSKGLDMDAKIKKVWAKLENASVADIDPKKRASILRTMRLLEQNIASVAKNK